MLEAQYKVDSSRPHGNSWPGEPANIPNLQTGWVQCATPVAHSLGCFPMHAGNKKTDRQELPGYFSFPAAVVNSSNFNSEE